MHGQVRAAAALIAALAVRAPAHAQEEPPPPPPAPAEDAERRTLEEEIQRDLARPAEPRGSDGSAAPQGGTAGSTGGNAMARLLLLPDVSAVGSASVGWDDETEKPAFAFDELELALQAVVDPYARADVYLAFSDAHGVEIEEAFLTTLSLPAALQLEAGKFFSPFGRLNGQHPHAWEFVDAPLPSLLLAEGALGGAGVQLGWLAPLPWYAELLVAAQSVAPGEEDEARLLGTARLSQYVSVGEATTLGLGLSAARRDEARGEFRDLAGADAYVRFRPLDSRSYVTLSGELYARRFVGVEGVSEGFETGFWAQVFGGMGRFVGAGLRWDEGPVEEVGDVVRFTGLVGWFPSEFQRIRLQVSYERRPGGEDGLSGLLQVEFGIGAHGAHPF